MHERCALHAYVQVSAFIVIFNKFYAKKKTLPAIKSSILCVMLSQARKRASALNKYLFKHSSMHDMQMFTYMYADEKQLAHGQLFYMSAAKP
jgi:hypothetical protein